VRECPRPEVVAMSAQSSRWMTSRTVLLAVPGIVAVLAVVGGVALERQAPQPLSGTITSRHVVLADASDDAAQQEEEEQEQEQINEQNELQEQLSQQEMLQSEQEAEQQNELATQEAQQAEQQGLMVEQQATGQFGFGQ